MGPNKREYNSAILAALLHDVGKLLHRGGDEYKGKHEQASAEFIRNFSDQLRNDEFYDLELLKKIIKYHHSSKHETLNDTYFSNKQDEEKERIWQLFKIVMRADSYSCAERDREQPWRRDVDKKKAPLDAIFSNINLDVENRQEASECRYHLGPLSPLTSFPDSITSLTQEELSRLIEDFRKDIPDFSQFNSFDDILNSWLNLLEEYTWAVPSDTRYEKSDVSLYDHLRSSAAIAACLFRRHAVALEKGKNLDRINEFILVGGDFSGIQDYIFDITNRGSGGASKRLRARSFFVSLFSEVTIHKILNALGLPLVCNLFSAGGKFLLLAPNIDEVDDALQTVKTEIEEEIHQTFFNQFSFLMSWMRIRGFREEFKTYSFFETAEEMFHQLESEKLRKSQGVLRDEKAGVWNVNAFKATKMYGQYKDTGDCKICGKGPATILEETDQETGESVLSCPICYRDKATIGQELPKSNYVAFGKGFFAKDADGKKIAIFSPKSNGYQKEKESYYVKLLKDCEDTDEYYLIYDIGGNTEKQVPNNQKRPIRKYIANHVPLGPGERVLSFEEISHLSRWQKNGELYGSDLLGILKADIDNLGLIFSKGFENPGMTEARLDNIDRKTVSRFLTMSRMVNLFFSGWIKGVMSDDHKSDTITELSGMENIDKDRFAKYLSGKQINFHNIYTVYSAGDDLVLVGPWETMIIFSIFLNMQFRKFTCNNKFITLSAGLTFVKPKHPIASAIRKAEELLKKSKEAGKNRITFFGTTTEWQNLSPLINFFLFLDEKLNANNSRINSAFLYRLLEYHHMALRYFDEDNVLGLKYLSAISYDIGRNIVEWDRAGKIKRGHEEREYLQPLVNETPDKHSLIYNIKVPLFWALYRNRKVRTDEHSSDI